MNVGEPYRAVRKKDLREPSRLRTEPLTEGQKRVLTEVYGYVVRPVHEDIPTGTFYPPGNTTREHVADEIIWHEE